jgi:hypothetical protein
MKTVQNIPSSQVLLSQDTELGLKTSRPPHMMKTEDLFNLISETSKPRKRSSRADSLRSKVITLSDKGLVRNEIVQAMADEGVNIRDFYVYTILRSLK